MTTSTLNLSAATVVLREEAVLVLEELELTITGSVLNNPETHSLAITDTENGNQPWIVTFNIGGLPDGTVMIKDYTEFIGIAGALAEIGVIEILGDTFVGALTCHCFIVRVLPSSTGA